MGMMPNVRMRAGWLYGILALVLMVFGFLYYESLHIRPSPKPVPPIHDQR